MVAEVEQAMYNISLTCCNRHDNLQVEKKQPEQFWRTPKKHKGEKKLIIHQEK